MTRIYTTVYFGSGGPKISGENLQDVCQKAQRWANDNPHSRVTTLRVVSCPNEEEAKEAGVGDQWPVVAHII